MSMSDAELMAAALNGTLDIDAHLGNEGEGEGNESQTPPAEVTQPQATGQEAATTTTTTTTDDEPEGAPIASKSGNYTIPFEKLATARDRVKSLEAENETLKAQLADHLSGKQAANLANAQDAAQARADAGQAASQADQNLTAAQAAISQGVDVSLFGDFSEEAIAKGIQALNERLAAQMEAKVDAKLAEALKPMREREAQTAEQAYYGAIGKAHPDMVELYESAEFAQWRQSLPSFIAAGVEQALKSGTALQVIEVFDSFKAANGGTKAAGAAKTAPEVPPRVPTSLSEMAGSPPVDEVEQMLHQADRNPAALVDRFHNMTPEQISKALDKLG